MDDDYGDDDGDDVGFHDGNDDHHYKKQHLLPSCQSLGAFQTFTNDAGCGEMVTGMTMIK